MTGTTNDPIAQAAAQIHADAAPSSTEPSLIEEFAEGLHTLEQKFEHLIHPSAEVAQPGESSATATASNTPPTANCAATSATDTTAATADANASPSTASESTGGTEGNAATPADSAAAQESTGEDPNADAPVAASQSESGTSSSVSPVSPVEGTLVAIGSDARKRARVAIDHLRAHFWTFDTSAVQHLHRDLDFLEGLFK